MLAINKIRSAYESVFGLLFQWSSICNGKHYYNMLHASMAISAVIVVNIFTLLSIIYVVSGWSLMREDSRIPELLVLIFMALLVLANYRYFSTPQRRKRIEKTEMRKHVGLKVLLLAGGSVAALFLTWGYGLLN